MTSSNARRPDWLVEYEGPGFCTHSRHDTEADAYTSARTARQCAENGEGVGVTSWVQGEHWHHDVRAVCVLRRDGESGEYLAHSRRWRKAVPAADALTPRPAA